MRKYRITKYNPNSRDIYGRYIGKEWTSCSDIGKSFDNKILNASEYKDTEDNYIKAINIILRNNNIQTLVVEEMEKYFDIDEVQESLEKYHLSLIDTEEILFKSITNGSKISSDNIPIIVKLLLRECFWCVLTTPKKDIRIEFGYDYYMYVSCEEIVFSTIDEIKKLKLYVEEV